MQESNRAPFDLLISTGVRYSEVRQLVTDPSAFDEEYGRITILISQSKSAAFIRTVVLGDRGELQYKPSSASAQKSPGNVQRGTRM